MEFVQVNPGRKSTDTGERTNIRKAAMRAFRRKERLERVKAFREEVNSETNVKQECVTSNVPVHPPSISALTILGKCRSRESSMKLDTIGPPSATRRSQTPSAAVGAFRQQIPEYNQLYATGPRAMPKILELPLPGLSQDAPGTEYLFNYCKYLVATDERVQASIWISQG